jgi:hypothetical protein
VRSWSLGFACLSRGEAALARAGRVRKERSMPKGKGSKDVRLRLFFLLACLISNPTSSDDGSPPSSSSRSCTSLVCFIPPSLFRPSLFCLLSGPAPSFLGLPLFFPSPSSPPPAVLSSFFAPALPFFEEAFSNSCSANSSSSVKSSGMGSSYSMPEEEAGVGRSKCLRLAWGTMDAARVGPKGKGGQSAGRKGTRGSDAESPRVELALGLKPKRPTLGIRASKENGRERYR